MGIGSMTVCIWEGKHYSLEEHSKALQITSNTVAGGTGLIIFSEQLAYYRWTIQIGYGITKNIKHELIMSKPNCKLFSDCSSTIVQLRLVTYNMK